MLIFLFLFIKRSINIRFSHVSSTKVDIIGINNVVGSDKLIFFEDSTGDLAKGLLLVQTRKKERNSPVNIMTLMSNVCGLSLFISWGAGVLMGAGDVLAQLAVERCPLHKYDPIRSSRYLILGTLGLVSENVHVLHSPVASGTNFYSKKSLFFPSEIWPQKLMYFIFFTDHVC